MPARRWVQEAHVGDEMGWRLREKHAALRLHLCVGMFCVRLLVHSLCVRARTRVSVSVCVCVSRRQDRRKECVHRAYKI